MPSLLERLLLLVLLGLAVTEDLGSEIVTNDGDFIILVALEGLVGDGVNVHGGISGLAGQLTELLA